MSIQSIAMKQALEQLRQMRESVRPPGIEAGEVRGPASPLMPPSGEPKVNFTDTMKFALDRVNEQQRVSRELQTAYVRGDDVSLTDVAIAMQKSSVAFEATVQVRNKILESYKEIMSMSV
ncbi:MAG: flagellar hook-basal body complex protein FliE [Steroidobacteraceae bacterium]|jgi:flagellar hook-basal body complex protein FliE